MSALSGVISIAFVCSLVVLVLLFCQSNDSDADIRYIAIH
jgi:hypothetical protein